MAAKKTETKEKELIPDIYIGAQVRRAFNGTTKFDDQIKNHLTLFHEEMPYDKITAYDGVRSSFIPTWYKDQDGYINLSSIYDIPVRRGNKDLTFAEWVATGMAVGSDITIRIRQKEGRVYPVCLMVNEDGEKRDIWEGFNDQ